MTELAGGTERRCAEFGGVVDVPGIVRRKAMVAGAERWLDGLDELVDALGMGSPTREFRVTPPP